MVESARSTGEWQQADLDNYLHPFTDYKALLDDKALVITRGQGCYVWDSDNNRYLDGLAGLACVNIGYGRTELGRAAAAQIGELSYFNSFFKSTNPHLKQRLNVLSETPQVGEVRSCGMIAAVELVMDHETMEPIAGTMEDIERYTEVFRARCLEQGIIVRPIGSTIMLCPPLIITGQEIDFLVDKLQVVLDGFEKVIRG